MRPQGAPPAKSLQEDLEAARASSNKKPTLKRPPAPPPKRNDNPDDEELQPLSKRKPPPSEAPPEGAAKDLSKLRQGPRPPKPLGPPPNIGAPKIELLDAKMSGKAGMMLSRGRILALCSWTLNTHPKISQRSPPSKRGRKEPSEASTAWTAASSQTRL